MVPPSLPSPPRALSGWEQDVKNPWREHRPKTYWALQKQGLLDQSVRQAVQQTKEAMLELVLNQGMSHPQAWNLLREEWMYLPGEEHQPVLGDFPDRDAVAVSQEAPHTFVRGQINQETYRKALPHFIASARHFQNTGRTVVDFVREAYRTFGTGIRPYLKQFLLDVKVGRVHLGSASEEVWAPSVPHGPETTIQNTPSTHPSSDQPARVGTTWPTYAVYGLLATVCIVMAIIALLGWHHSANKAYPVMMRSPEFTDTTPPHITQPLPPPRLPPRTLPTGTELPSIPGRRGLGVLTVRNGTAHDAVVKLVEGGTTQQTRRARYVQAHDTLNIEAIAKGRYVLRFALGTDWD
jgi:hypothetical protein